MGSKKRGGTTQRGFGDPAEGRASTPDAAPAPPAKSPAKAPAEPPRPTPPSPAAAPPSPLASAKPPALEIEAVSEEGSPALLSGPWRAVEIWTRNRIYGLDAQLVCRSVVDRATDAPAPDHPVLGARLLGGQRRDPSGAIREVTHPYPGRGASAVFASGLGTRLRVSETSPVTRVVLRQRRVTVGPDDAPPPWEDLAATQLPSS
ncbi:MAG TPA: hypothetical protein RMH85_22425 [Polyangiaceae bacterium LLY-WYZ-15_(1-7)]|nr:hypothetical protein [Myxococcales bacterium]MBJ72040.1 hypothetical protein [Sandaracinus sp.]HJK92515.1 hypothetical protein [Polyangiaceae bacterium LLY-WYZ-15_(1-7)]HJL02577.1 hypothetical protein [Polyangiaceae bacterium LLY-WYZ-15_(1-7)]HJL11247.1 hypothetical protein [Polyangiaceae bacterium LLY-WYZ-15_(1-7)]